MIDGNGVLLPANPSSQEIADAIMTIATASGEEQMAMRKKSYQIWASDYNAEKNYNSFVELLLKV